MNAFIILTLVFSAGWSRIPLKSTGVKHKDICNVTEVCGNTLRTYPRDYRDGGVEKLKRINYYRPESELERHRD